MRPDAGPTTSTWAFLWTHAPAVNPQEVTLRADRPRAERDAAFWTTPRGLAAIGLIAVVTYYLLMEHRAHLFDALPALVILACLVLHLFMHRSHDRDGPEQRNGR